MPPVEVKFDLATDADIFRKGATQRVSYFYISLYLGLTLENKRC